VTKNKIGALVSTVALSVVLAACGSSSSSSSSGTSSSASTSSSGGSTTVTGAGSTLALPVYQTWGTHVSGVTVNYQGVGSGAGIAQFTAKTVNFGATDPPMKNAEVAAATAAGGTAVVHVPTLLGAITVAYNLSGVPSGLKLDGATIANIYLGKIKTWNDPAITSLNPGVKLPSTAITVIHRSDSSGTTAGFTGFLAKESSTWASQVGSGKDVKWPTGTGAAKNSGVAGAIKQTPGAVGYVEQAYALQNNFTVADVKNAAGNYVAPTLASTTAAGEGLTVPNDLRFTVSAPSNPSAYPIVSQSFIVVWKDMCKAGVSQNTAKGVVAFLNYGLGPGQALLSQLDYAQVPPAILSQAKAHVAALQCNGAPLT
jgi:phosphate transport system substrate-binding protein